MSEGPDRQSNGGHQGSESRGSVPQDRSGARSKWQTESDSDRAVTETLGFVLVFALITTTIAITFTFGIGGLENTQSAERDANVERAFDVLQDNLRDLSRAGVPSRATEIRLAGGELAVGDPTTIRVVNESGGVVHRTETRPIVYRGAGETVLAYENGAVLRMGSPETGVPLSAPDLVVDDGTDHRTVVYSIVRIRGTPAAIDGDRTTLVVGTAAERRAVIPERPSGDNLSVEIESPHADAWRRHYEAAAATTAGVSVVDGNGDVTVEFELDDGDSFVVHQTTIDVSFSE